MTDMWDRYKRLYCFSLCNVLPRKDTDFWIAGNHKE